MNAFKKQQEDQQKAYDSSMRKPLIFSVAFHIFVVVIGTLGLPYFVTKPEPREVAITIEMAELDLVSQTDVLAPPKPVKEPKEKPAPQKEQKKPKFEQTKAEEEPEEVKPPEPEKVAEQEKVPDLPKPEDKKEEKKEVKKEEPKIKKPPVPVKKPKPPVQKEKEEEFDVNKLLTTLTDENSEPEAPKPEEPVKNEPSQTPSQIARVTGKLTRSEEDNLNSGVSPCWNVNAGGKDAETLKVSLEVHINPDMSVREVKVIDQMRYAADNAFRTAAEAARRALLATKCSKLKLPPEKYEEWKVFTYHFDPSQML